MLGGLPKHSIQALRRSEMPGVRTVRFVRGVYFTLRRRGLERMLFVSIITLLYFVPASQISSLVDGHETLQRIRPYNGFPSDLEHWELAPVHQSTHGVSSVPGHFCRFFNSHTDFCNAHIFFLLPIVLILQRW